MSIDPKFIELKAVVFMIILYKMLMKYAYRIGRLRLEQGLGLRFLEGAWSHSVDG